MPMFSAKPIGHVGGHMKTWPRGMQCPPKKSSSSRNVLSKKVLQLPCLENRSPMHPVETSQETKKPIGVPSIVVTLLRDMNGGHDACSRIQWWSGLLWHRCPM